MDSFSIAQLSQYSGIKPHTIRIWEKRYNALQPDRSDGNTRYYNSDQLRRLLNIVTLLDAGHKVSEVCSLPDKKLFARVEAIQQSVPNESSDYFVAQLAAAGVNYDESRFVNIFSHCLLRYGIKDCYLKVIYPLLVRIGLMWTSNRIISAPEHFISYILRQKIFTAVDSLPPAAEGADKWLLFLPEDEFHEIGLLFAQYLIRLSGKKVFYLGGNVPLPSLIEAVKATHPAHLLLFLVHHDDRIMLQQYLQKVKKHFPGKKIYVACGAELAGILKPVDRIQWLHSVTDMEKVLAI